MAGGPLLKVTEGSPVSRGVAALLGALAVVAMTVWGYGALHSARAANAALTDAIAACDDLARTVAAGNDAQESVDKALSEDFTSAWIVREGGVDEFGISRGTELIGPKNRQKSALSSQLLDHARAVSTAAADAAKSKTLLAASRLQATVGGGVETDGTTQDGVRIVAVAFRKSEKDMTAAGVAVVQLAVPRTPAGAPTWIWLLALLGCGLMLALSSTTRLPKWLAGVGALLPVIAIATALIPADPTSTSATLQVLSASLLFPHEASVAAPALIQAQSWLLAALVVVTIAVGALVEPLAWMLRSAKEDPAPYLYVGPAVVATGVLVFVPFAVGVGLAFTDRSGQFVGIANYLEVIRSLADDTAVTHFWRTLGHTVLWTVANVVLHLTLGLGLAIVLNRPDLRGRKVYRLLLIVPWAVPSYITALTWKWLFNTQYGPINAMLGMIGVGQVDWLGESAFTNFAANLATNVWLGFPFMMVISLGALQSIPADLYEAASIDGASGWQKFRHVTLPLLRPALFPAVILGTIWTFNLFNVIYLVSGGGPDHKTEILITEAYYLFSVMRRIGLAAAYSVLIFVLLLAYTLITNKLTQATEAVDR